MKESYELVVVIEEHRNGGVYRLPFRLLACA